MAANESEYPFKLIDLSDEEKEERRKVFGGCESSGEVEAIRTEPHNMYICSAFRKIAEEIYNFELRPDDIWIITYPKCGTTWTQEIVWQISRGLDKEASYKQHLFVRSPFLEIVGLVPDISKIFPPPDPKQGPPTPEMLQMFESFSDSVGYSKRCKSQRIIKSHLPLEFLPPKLLDTCKVIYVCRNVKDVCVSFYHHINLNVKLYGFTGEFSDHAELFKKGELSYGDYWFHLKSAWKRRSHPNMKFIWYEEMKKDFDKVLRDLCDFTEHPLTDDQLRELKEHVTIENMRKISTNIAPPSEKETMQKFFRKGQVGDWKNYFKGEKAAEWDAWIKENLEGTDIDMSFD